MHDWTLNSVTLDWRSGNTRLDLLSPRGEAVLLAHATSEVHVPRRMEWGPSVSINCVHGPAQREDGLFRLAIEMQSGDRIELVAASFTMPGH